MTIQPITMPKWGLAMQEGTLVKWAVEEGQPIANGQEIADIETTKIANVYESPVAGILRKRVARDGDVLPVGALLGVVADTNTSASDIDAYVADFLSKFKVEDAAAETGPEPEFADIAGKTMRYLKVGQDGATPVVMIHGFGADLSSFMFNQDDLAQGRAVYVIDLPGHGASSKNVGDGSLDRLAADVLAFMQVVGIGTAHLVGHSLGGAIAVSIAALRPERVQNLVLIAPSGFGPDLSQEFLDGFIAETRARKMKAVLEYLVADPETISSAMVDDVLKFKRLDGATDALRAIAAHLAQGGRQQVDLRAKLETLTMPITVIWGEKDRIAPIAHADGLSGSVRVVRVAGAGHIPHMEKAAEVNAALKQGVGGTA